MCPGCDDDGTKAAAAAAADGTSDSAAPAKAAADEWHTWDTIPQYLRDNHFVFTGYRVDLGWKRSLRSLFSLHNETMNVWTHLIGFFVVAVLLASTIVSLSPYGLDRLDLTHHPAPHATDASAEHTGTHALPAPAAAASTATEADEQRGMWERLLSSPEAARAALDRWNARIGPAVTHATNTLRAKAARLADASAERFTAFLHGVEEQAAAVQRAAASDDALGALRDMLVHGSEELRHGLVQGSDDALTYAHYLVDQFRVRGGAALKLLALNTQLSTSHCVARPRRRPAPANANANATGAVASAATATTTVAAGDATAAADADSDAEVLTGVAATTNTGAAMRVSVDGHNVSGGTGLGSGVSGGVGNGAAVVAAVVDDVEIVCGGLVSHLPVWPISVFMLSAMACLLFSAVYHLFSSHSARIASQFQRMDYVGIVLLIAGSNVPVLWYGFACHPLARAVYLCVCVASGAICFVLTTSERFLTPHYRGLRTMAFVAMGVGGVVPALHLLALGVDAVFVDLVVMGAVYLLGACVYVLRVPERFRPGAFDIWLNSHQLWHCFVAGAILVHYSGVLRFFEWRIHNACPAL